MLLNISEGAPKNVGWGGDASSYVQRVFNSSNYNHIKAHAVERDWGLGPRWTEVF